MTMGKRQLVLAALVVALGAAVYLNWQFSGNNQLPVTDAAADVSNRTLGEAQLVEGSAVSGAAKPSATSSPASSVSSAPSAAKENTGAATYFSEANLSRRKARDEATELALKVLKDAESNDAAKKEAAAKAGEITENMVKESNIENLIKAKGFSDCLVFLQNSECSVVVKTKDSSPNNAVMIKDIVAGQSGVAYDKIKIVEVQ